ncbi:DeoR/GlpR family DNA-binding transcription regulator [Okibacterium endophyticum]
MTDTARAGRSAADRQAEIVAMLERDGRVEVNDLSATLDVTEETIRRDLRNLERSGSLTRAHGGAIKAAGRAEDLTRITGADVPPRPVAVAALPFVPEHGGVFLDAGADLESLAAMLPDSERLQVVTSSIPAAILAGRKPSLSVYNLGGAVDHDDGSQSGQWARETLERVRFGVAFITADGVSADGWLTAATPKSAALKRRAVASADRTILVIGPENSSSAGLVTFAQLRDVDVAVCDAGVSHEFLAMLDELGIHVVRAGKQP